MSICVAFVGQKGGVGKSTLARALAASAAGAGIAVKTVDLDPQQATITVWAQARDRYKVSPSIKVDPFLSAEEALATPPAEELLIIDTPGSISDDIARVADHADLLVQPASPTVDDLYPAVLVFQALEKVGVARDKFTFALCRTLAEEEALDARAYLQGLGYAVLTGDVPEHLAYRRAMNRGRAITEADQPLLSARAEAMMADLLARVGLTRPERVAAVMANGTQHGHAVQPA
jgi:chromosome partitioning protein